MNITATQPIQGFAGGTLVGINKTFTLSRKSFTYRVIVEADYYIPTEKEVKMACHDARGKIDRPFWDVAYYAMSRNPNLVPAIPRWLYVAPKSRVEKVYTNKLRAINQYNRAKQLGLKATVLTFVTIPLEEETLT